MLYLVGAGSRATAGLPDLAGWSAGVGWDPWIIPSPTGRQFLDHDEAVRLSGHPVFAELVPAATAALPGADLVVVAPATFNTVTKLANAASDTLALSVTNEAIGAGVPVLVVPWCNAALRGHPAFPAALATLRGWGLTVLDAHQSAPLPWSLVREQIDTRQPG